MKKSLPYAVLSLILMISSSFISTKSPVKKPADTAVVYIYRVGQFNAALANWAVFVDEKKICKLSNNRFIKIEVTPGKHVFTAKVGGVSVFKKETDVELNAETGQTYYIACNVKTSLTRSRMELIEVTKGTGEKQMEKMTLDNCQENIADSTSNR